MSGICGVVDLTGATLDPAQIRRMTALLERRGPDGTHVWQEGPVALGHTLLATTPEALHERQPFTHTATGCTITADLRLDNRDTLMSTLGLTRRPGPVGDAEIALYAYLKWGEDCPRHLQGDFAFAIWDPRAGRLFCARDPMGMKQLIHCHLPGRLFAFATEPRAVLEAGGVPRRINEARIAEYLAGGLEAVDATSTFFEEVCRLSPAHVLTVSRAGMTQRRCWRLVPGPMLKLGSDREYAEAFLEVFTEAVSARLRAPGGVVGSMLSGGMDSGAIVAVACQIFAAEGQGAFPTFSAIGADPESCVETRSIQAALTMPNLAPTLVNWAGMDGYADALIALTREIAEPFDGHMTLPRAVYLHAHRAGMKVLLDGAGGDLCFSNSAHVHYLLRRGHWIEAWQETAAENRFWGHQGSTLRSWISHQRRAWVPGWVSRTKRALQGHASGPGTLGLCHPDLAARVNLAERRSRERAQYPVGWMSHRERLAHILQQGYMTAARERYDRTASACSIEARDPFMDTRVMQFCVSLPVRQLTRDGWPKALLRRSMADLVPDAVRWRQGKEHLGWTFSEALTRHWPAWDVLNADGRIRGYAADPGDKPDMLEARLDLTHLARWLTNADDLLTGQGEMR